MPSEELAGRWGRLALVHKGGGRGKPVSAPSSYRPLSMLDNISNLLERLLLARLTMAVAANGALSNNQYDFRQGRGTIQTIEEVLSLTGAATSGPTQDRDLLLLVILNVRNAINTAHWTTIKILFHTT